MSTTGAVASLSKAPAGRRWIIFAAKLAVTMAILALVYRKIGNADVFGRLAAADLVPLAGAVILTVAQLLLGMLRWHVVLEALGQRVAFARVSALFVIGVFFNICVPGGVGGDAYRAWQISRDGVPLAKAVNSVLLDRVFVTLALLLVVLAEYPWVAGLAGVNAQPFAVISVGGIAMIGIALVMDRVVTPWRRWRAVNALAILASDLRRVLLRSPGNVVALALSAATVALFCASVWLVALSLSVPLSLGAALLLVPPVMVIMLLPVTIAGWGLREGAMVVALGAIGVAPEAAFAISILVGLIVMGVSLAGGALWLAPAGRSADD